MDEFGVLTERYGLKPQGKSAPMAELKRPDGTGSARGRSPGQNRASADRSSSHASASSWNSSSGSKAFADDYSGFLQSDSGSKAQGFGNLDDFGDLFGGSSKPSKPPASNSGVDYDSLFNSSATSSSTYDNDDIFGGMPGVKNSASVGGNGVFGSFASPPRQSSPVDDLLGGYQNDDHDDIFGSIGTKSGNTDSNGSEAGHGAAESDDLIPGFGGSSPPADGHGASESDDLIPGFGGSSPPAEGQRRQPRKTNVYSAESSSNLSEDPFVVLESISKPVHTSSEMSLDPLGESSQFGNFQRANEVGDKVKSPSVSSLDELENFAMGQAWGNTDTRSDFLSVGKRSGAEKKARGPDVSSIDELEDFFIGRVRRNADIQSDFLSGGNSSGPEKKADGYCKRGPYENKHKAVDDLESFFSAGLRSSSVPKSRPTSSTKSKEVPKTPPKPTFEVGSSMKKASSATNFMDDFSLMFGAASFAGEFEEIEGESEERRRARLGRHERTQERMAKAVAEMNQRDSQTQQEQEERRRIAENIDMEIKQWAAGKEGNLRALLSSLQQVLWPESGWEPVSLTDLITSTSVKLVYRKATLRVHPDKVQQKGANLQQKYTAEKVFDILKEAWKRFEAEELR